MIRKITLENFRSHQKSDFPLGQINLLAGPNSVGKSSVLFGLLALKNFVKNPNQPLDSLFQIAGGPNLGGFGAVVFDQNKDLPISISVETEVENNVAAFAFSAKKTGCSASISGRKPFPFFGALPFSMPYSMSQKAMIEGKTSGVHFELEWDGLRAGRSFEIDGKMGISEQMALRSALCSEANSPLEALSRVDFVPSKRGFSMPFFNQTAAAGAVFSETEIANLIASEKGWAELISVQLERIVGRKLRVETAGAKAGNFQLKTTETATGLTLDLANEGLGVQQMVAFLAKTLPASSQFIIVEEPDAHLDAKTISRFFDALVDLSNFEGKQFLIATHSDNLILELLAAVEKSRIPAHEAAIFNLKKDGKATRVELEKM